MTYKNENDMTKNNGVLFFAHIETISIINQMLKQLCTVWYESNLKHNITR